MKLYTCQCCGYKTLKEGTRASNERCVVCYWIDNREQNMNPEECLEGPNEYLRLRDAQNNFIEMGACEPTWTEHVIPPKVHNFIKDDQFRTIGLYTCQCCGYKTLLEKTGCSHEICKVCGWQDDADDDGGANYVTLEQARRNFKLLGESDPEHPIQYISSKKYEKDQNFNPNC